MNKMMLHDDFEHSDTQRSKLTSKSVPHSTSAEPTLSLSV